MVNPRKSIHMPMVCSCLTVRTGLIIICLIGFSTSALSLTPNTNSILGIFNCTFGTLYYFLVLFAVLKQNDILLNIAQKLTVIGLSIYLVFFVLLPLTAGTVIASGVLVLPNMEKYLAKTEGYTDWEYDSDVVQSEEEQAGRPYMNSQVQKQIRTAMGLIIGLLLEVVLAFNLAVMFCMLWMIKQYRKYSTALKYTEVDVPLV